MNISTLLGFIGRPLMAVILMALTTGALAQKDKTIVSEPVPVFPAFTQWVSTFVTVLSEVPVATVENVPLTLIAPPAQTPYQPMPVILGLPELPLVGSGIAQAAQAWRPSFNYQGVHLRQVVLNAAGNKRESRSMGVPLRAGHRFKLRITPTFDAVAEVDQVIGDTWYGNRTGQLYPQAGMSVHIKAGETVDIPMGSHEYFTMNRLANERMVVSVRHVRAVEGARSEQPAYRQDSKTGSSYLQLVPPGQFPAMEQLIVGAW